MLLPCVCFLGSLSSQWLLFAVGFGQNSVNGINTRNPSSTHGLCYLRICMFAMHNWTCELSS